MAKKISASDIFSEEDIFLGIRNSAEKTILTFQEIDAEVKKLGANIKKDLSGADFGNTKGINAFVSATQKANDAKNKSIQIDKVLVQATKDVAAADKALIDIEIKKQKLVQEEIRTAQQKAKIEQANANAAKKTAEASKVQTDTYKKLVTSTRDLKNESKELGARMLEMERNGLGAGVAYDKLSKQYMEVTNEARKSDEQLKHIDKTIGDNFRNVGNYEGATKGLKQQLREMTQALQNMESTDPRFKQMTIDAGELKDKIQDTNAVIKSTAGSAVENLGTGIAKAGKVGIDAFAGMTGAMGLFGIESEGAMQAMLKLQQLAAMSEALTSLGALGDTVTEIKAAFTAAAMKLGIFTTAKEADIAVTEVQTVATEGASVATKGLGNAMKALPIVALIAGIAALAYGIYSLVSSNSAAAAATKKREEAERKANEETHKTSVFVAKESAEFVGLIYQLKTSNENSKERSSLINKINSQYGTTLKNLKDETAFQAALNLAIEDYIKFQEARYKMTKNDALIELNFAKQGDARAQLAKETAKLLELEKKMNIAKAQRVSIDYTIKYGAAQALRQEKENKIAAERAISDYNKQSNVVFLLGTNLDALKTRMEGYAGSNIKLSSITEGRYIPVTESATKVTTDLTTSTTELNKAIEDEIALQELRAEQEYARRVSEKEALDAIDLQIEKDAEAKRLEAEIADEKKQEDALEVKRAKAEEKRLKRLQTEAEFIKMTTDFFIKNSEKKIAQMDKEIAKAESQYTILQQLAANGNINAQESLAEQQRIINEANARKEKELKRQQRIKLAESVYSTYNSKVAAGSEHPLMDTIKDTMLLQQFIASLPTFYDGTEDTGKNGNGIDGKGGFHAVLHPNERVIPKSLNEQIGGLSNEALAKMASEYQNGKIIRSNSQIGSAFDTAILVGKLDELTSAIKQKPETNIGIGEITQSVMEIVKSTKQGNTTTYNRYKVRR